MAGDKPVTLILGSNPLISKRLPHVYAILITMMIDFLTERRDVTETGDRKNFDLMAYFDEVLMLHMEELAEWIKYVREMGVRLFLLGQSLWELEEEYGKGLTANTITVEFRPRNSTEANAIQALANERHKQVLKLSETEKPGEFFTASQSYSSNWEHRPLITAADAFKMENICYLFGLGDPYEVKLLPAWDHPKWKHQYGPTKGTWGTRMDRNRWYGYSNPHQGQGHEEVVDAEFEIVSEGMIDSEKLDESRLIGRRSRVKRNL
jgi:type IV secretion system protein VirD4